MLGVSPPTILSPSLKTTAGQLLKTKGSQGGTTTLCHQALTRPLVAATANMPICPTVTNVPAVLDQARNSDVVHLDMFIFGSLHWFFLSWYLWDGNEVFYSLMICFINSTFFLFSCVNIDVVLLGSVMVLFLIFCVLICLRGSLWENSSRFICPNISSISWPDN